MKVGDLVKLYGSGRIFGIITAVNNNPADAREIVFVRFPNGNTHQGWYHHTKLEVLNDKK